MTQARAESNPSTTANTDEATPDTSPKLAGDNHNNSDSTATSTGASTTPTTSNSSDTPPAAATTTTTTTTMTVTAPTTAPAGAPGATLSLADLYVDPDTKLHPLTHAWAFWYMRRSPGSRTQESYEKSIKPIGEFNTVEQFWTYHTHMVRPNELPVTSDYHLFKAGIKPIWEDQANALGGKWILRLKKGLASKYWEDLVLGLIGEQFDVQDDICGAVVSLRFQEDLISVWNRDHNNRESTLKIRDTIKRILCLAPSVVLEYKCHDASIKDNSSFRNTDVFR